jgi:hypothetical protein
MNAGKDGVIVGVKLLNYEVEELLQMRKNALFSQLLESVVYLNSIR